jgi:hypothetical protein
MERLERDRVERHRNAPDEAVDDQARRVAPPPTVGIRSPCAPIAYAQDDAGSVDHDQRDVPSDQRGPFDLGVEGDERERRQSQIGYDRRC